MISLSEATTKARKGAIVFIIGFVACGILGIIRLNVPDVSEVVAEIKANDKFGDLPELDLKNINYAYVDDFSFELATKDGELPKDIPNISYVYKFSIPRQSLTSRQTADAVAKSLGFNKAPKIDSNRYYTWTSDSGTQVLNYDSLIYEIKLTTDLDKDARLLEDHTITPNYDAYQSGFVSFMSSIPSIKFTDDYAAGSVVVDYLNFENNRFVPVAIQASSRTDYVALSLYRSLPVIEYTVPTGASDELKAQIALRNYSARVVPPDPSKGYIRSIVGGRNVGNDTIYELVAKPKPIDYTDIGIYNIKNVEQAYQELLDGKAFLVYMSEYEDNKDRVPKSLLINGVKLAYYEQDDYNSYIQPVYMFEGLINFTDNRRADFVFYLPAII